MQLWGFIILSFILNGSGQLLLKKGMTSLATQGKSSASLLTFVSNIFTTPLVLLGLFLYGTSMLVWLKILTTADVSYAYPIVISLTFVVVSAGAVVFLNEEMGILRALGIGIIILGVIFVSQS